MSFIISNVGLKATNNVYDVKLVQGLLKEGYYGCNTDGIANARTIDAIKDFQSCQLCHKEPSGLITPDSETMTELSKFAFRKYYVLSQTK